MYRSLLPVVLYFTAVTSAPQAGNSDITYVKIQPQDRLANQAPARSPYRESRIEILPLTISGNNNSSKLDEGEELNGNTSGNYRLNETESQEIENISEENISEENVSEEYVSEEVLEDAISSENVNKDNEEVQTDNTYKNVSESNIIVQENNRHARSQEEAEIYESETTTAEAVTEKEVEVLAKKTEVETRTRAPLPRFIPKLSYFNKPNPASFSTNLVERPAKRRFKSKCRCEKIWNCPKLQITVPRCPNEYFMCCF